MPGAARSVTFLRTENSSLNGKQKRMELNKCSRIRSSVHGISLLLILWAIDGFDETQFRTEDEGIVALWHRAKGDFEEHKAHEEYTTNTTWCPSWLFVSFVFQ